MRIVRNLWNRIITTVVTAAVENIAHRVTLYVQAPGYQGVHGAVLGEVIDRSTSSATSGGHPVSMMGRFIRDNSGGGVATTILAVALEGGLANVGTGTINSACSVAAHCNDNDGTIDVLTNFRSQVSLNAGVITTLAHFCVDPSVTIGNAPVNEYAFLGLRPSARFSNAGPVFGPMGNVQAMAGGELAPPFHPGLAANRYYFGPGLGAGASFVPAALSANLLYATLVHVPHATTLARLGVRVTSAAGNIRLGLYRVANGIPTTLVVGSGSISAGSTGAKEFTTSTAIEAGTYALAIVSDNTPSINWHSDVTVLHGTGRVADDTGADSVMFGVHAFAALPSTFPAVSYVAVGGLTPSLWFRV